ncbi:MAG: glycosyltransferase family 2 protein [Candidatus Roizmanbacteria bacterium]
MSHSIPDHRLTSLTIFFPFYNDAGTVLEQIKDAYRVGGEVSQKLEVIAIHGGKSKDETEMKLNEAKILFPDLQIFDESQSDKGYAVIAIGLKKATSEWVFYTDGDRQYHVDDLKSLIETQFQTGAQMVNGYKEIRHDSWTRRLAGDLYARIMRVVLRLPVRDPDCDFRLISTALLIDWQPLATGAAIIQDLLIHLRNKSVRLSEVPVHHFGRTYGKSNYTVWKLTKETVSGMIRFWKYR